MNAKALVVLFILFAVGVASFYFSNNKGGINTAESIGSPLLPGLFEKLNDVDKIQLTGAGNNIVTTLEKNEKHWAVTERSYYPADISKIRSVVLALAEAKIIEEKTSNEELYSKLGVEDLGQKDAGGIQIGIFFDDQQYSLIVGKPGPQINKNRYVRLLDDKTSWLVDRKLDLLHDIAYWLRKDLLSIEPQEISEIVIELLDGSRLEIENAGEEENIFSVTNLTNPDSQVIDAEIHQITNALSSFQLLDVVSEADFSGGEPQMAVTYKLKSGANIYIVGYELDKSHYVSLRAGIEETREASSISDEAKSYISDIQTRLDGWIFKIPNVSYDSMHKREEDLLAISVDQLK